MRISDLIDAKKALGRIVGYGLVFYALYLVWSLPLYLLEWIYSYG